MNHFLVAFWMLFYKLRLIYLKGFFLLKVVPRETQEVAPILAGAQSVTLVVDPPPWGP